MAHDMTNEVNIIRILHKHHNIERLRAWHHSVLQDYYSLPEWDLLTPFFLTPPCDRLTRGSQGGGEARCV